MRFSSYTIVLVAMGMTVAGAAGAPATSPSPLLPPCAASSGLNCLRGADALFDGATLVYLDGVYSCRQEKGAAARTAELINAGGYELEFVGHVLSVPLARAHLPNGELSEILAKEGLVAC